MSPTPWSPRPAGVDDADEVARLLHDFNNEFAAPSPGASVLAARLRRLLAHDSTVVVLAGRPAVAVALVTFRSNVWYDGPVALLDELYVEPGLRGRGIGAEVMDLVLAMCRERGVELVEVNVDEGDVDAQRFYDRLGFSLRDPDSGERAFYVSMDLERG